MGSDKAWLEIEGQPLIKHVIAALAPVTTEISIIANDERYTKLGFPVFSDTKPGVGPLEAVRTALTNTRTSCALLVGCDLPFVTSELLSFLARLAAKSQAVVPRDPNGTLEPLCAAYSKDLLLAATRLIDGGERKVRLLFETARTRIVEFDEIRHLRNSQFFFENINTPEDYQRAIHEARGVRTVKEGEKYL